MSNARTTAAVALVCLKEFSAFKTSYVPGDVIPLEDTQKWGGATLAARLNNGFVEWQPVNAAAADEALTDDEPPADGEGGSQEVIEHLSVPAEARADKTVLVEWAREHLPNVTLDARRSLETLLPLVDEAVETHNAAIDAAAE